MGIKCLLLAHRLISDLRMEITATLFMTVKVEDGTLTV